jgi:hypothetical protein
MTTDITELLDDWEYDPESNVRKIEGADGVAKIQVRVDQGAFQGILQLNLDGRPDGKRPYDTDFVLDHYTSVLEEHRASHGGSDDDFRLDGESCKELFDESARIYGRYVFLLQIKEYRRVIRDTERNMNLFRFVHRYAADDEDRGNLEKWWPYILRIDATARAMLAVDDEDFDGALTGLASARQRIEDLKDVDAEEFFTERDRSIEAIDELVEELSGRRPLSEKERLQKELDTAISREEFERAAQLRDQLNDMAD